MRRSDGPLTAKRGISQQRDAGGAAAELADQIADPDAAVALVFLAPGYDSHRLAGELAARLAPTPVYGCTTAGEIGPNGFLRDSVVAVSVTGGGLRVGAGLASEVRKSGFSSGRRATLAAIEALGLELADLREDRQVALSFIDGLAGIEELFMAGAAGSAPHVRFLGGSASDYGTAEPAARVICDGRVYSDCGLILMLSLDTPFVVIKSEHMEPTEQRVVVTEIGPGPRVVRELDGRPAGEVYRELIGLADDQPLDAATAARCPFGYQVGGQFYVRSVMGVEGDALQFACAVDHGAVLWSMRPGDLVGTTARDLDSAVAALGEEPSLLLAFNCLGRFLETQATGDTEALAEVMARYPVVGYNTFGEQCNALHINHTLMALGLGRGSNG